jgi:hypothetical protein
MKKLWVFLMVFAFGNSVSAQNGYQEYTFGMDLEAIKSKFSYFDEWGYYYNGLFYTIMHLYKAEISGAIPNPQAVLGNEFKVFVTGEWLRDDDLAFLFSNNKLVGVITFFNRDNILSDIKKKYGNGSTYSVSWPNGTPEEGILWLNSQRFIIWEQRGSNNRSYQIVTYFEANWIRDVCRRRMENFRKEEQQKRSRID